MSQALYRKYRSKKLSEIVGQEHITKTLDNALKSGKISHAYLFTGPRGVGKTSIARILAHEINELAYTDESIHLDIIEIDAASNRRIDEIRDLREKVHIAPTSAKYKVYIIDEVHMLTKEAFNALLKTLEEPPAHVIFILATTELHKLPETIVSRTQRFTFKLIDEKTVAGHLRDIAKSEGMDIDDEALELLAQHGRGSFRDSISLLDQVGHSAKKVSRSDAEKLVGLAASEQIDRLLGAVLKAAPADVLAALDLLAEEGVSPAQAAKQLSAALRRRIMAGQADSTSAALLGSLLEVNGSPDPAGKLEVVLLSANLARTTHTAQPNNSQTVSAAPEKTEEFLQAPGSDDQTPSPSVKMAEMPEPEVVSMIESAEQPASPAAVVQKAVTTGEPAEWWDEVLTQIKTINNTLYGAMRMANPRVEGDTLNLGFKFKLHVSKVSEPSTQAKIRDAIKSVTGQVFQINAAVDKSEPQIITKAEEIPQPENPEVDSIKNIFGGGEVLES